MRRSYKAPKIHEDALQIIKDVAGTQLDAERSFQRKNIGHAAEKQFWKDLRIEDFC